MTGDLFVNVSIGRYLATLQAALAELAIDEPRADVLEAILENGCEEAALIAKAIPVGTAYDAIDVLAAPVAIIARFRSPAEYHALRNAFLSLPPDAPHLVLIPAEADVTYKESDGQV